MKIRCQHCGNDLPLPINSQGGTVTLNDGIKVECSSCGKTTTIPPVKLDFTSAGTIEKITALGNTSQEDIEAYFIR